MAYNYNRNPDADSLTMAEGAANDVLKGLTQAAELMSKARDMAKSYMRPLSYVAASIHRITDPTRRDRLWKAYVKIQLDAPDIEQTLAGVRNLMLEIRGAKSDAINQQEWADWNAVGRR